MIVADFTQVDAFADRPFTGNPAAVIPLDGWLDDSILQAVAAENNLAETAFVVPATGSADYELRWFTPTVEVVLCGHATLATGHVLLSRDRGRRVVRFRTRKSGHLEVRRAARSEEHTSELQSLMRYPCVHTLSLHAARPISAGWTIPFSRRSPPKTIWPKPPLSYPPPAAPITNCAGSHLRLKWCFAGMPRLRPAMCCCRAIGAAGWCAFAPASPGTLKCDGRLARSEGRPVGQAWVGTCSYWGSP